MGWAEIYARGEQMNRWPFTDLVSAVKRNCGDISGWRVLELGCGPSYCNEAFFRAEEARYVGIDSALNAQMWFDEYYDGGFRHAKTALLPMDFTKEFPEGPFDLICDRAAVTHNTTEDIQNTLRMAYEALSPGGWYIGIDYFGVEHSDYEGHTRHPWYSDGLGGQFEGCGVVHFWNGDDLQEMFIEQGFLVKNIAYKTRRDCINGTMLASFDIVARKPE